MFRNEHELAARVEKALTAARYRVRREVSIGGRHRLDLLATKNDVRVGVEVKFTSRGILDDLTKSRMLLPLPEVDEMYVCGPKVFMSEDVLALAGPFRGNARSPSSVVLVILSHLSARKIGESSPT